MPIEIAWGNDDKSLIRWNFVGKWTAQELRETIQKSNELFGTQSHTINHIIDLSQAVGLPANVINELRLAMRQMPENLGHVVVVTQGGIMEALGKTAQRFSWFSEKIHIVRTNEEALSYIGSL